MSNNFNDIMEKYYNAHQISKSMNILDMAALDDPSASIKPLKCIHMFLEPTEGWDKKVSRTGSDGEKCYYCTKQLSEKFSDYIVSKKGVSLISADSPQCKYCYWFCCKKYIEGQMKMTNKIIKANKIK